MAKLPFVLIGCVSIVVSLAMVFFVFPHMISNIQSESGFCGHIERGELTRISSLTSDKNIEGSFFLGSGHIETVRVYAAYTGSTTDGYTLLERPVSESVLFEDTEDNPYMETVTVWVCTSYGYSPVTQYHFHVPNNTIVMEYSV